MTSIVNLQDKLTQFKDHWQPKRVATINDYDVRLAKIEGEFVWHAHEETDELFLVVHGQMQIALRDRIVDLKEGELFVVPKGVEHKPIAEQECHILLLEPTETVNTGTAATDRTATITDL